MVVGMRSHAATRPRKNTATGRNRTALGTSTLWPIMPPLGLLALAVMTSATATLEFLGLLGCILLAARIPYRLRGKTTGSAMRLAIMT
jgi:hypothetical protein